MIDSDLNNSEILTQLLSIGNDDTWIDDDDKQNAADSLHSVIDLHYDDLESGDSAEIKNLFAFKKQPLTNPPQ